MNIRLIANKEEVTAPDIIRLIESSVPRIPTRVHSEMENKVPQAAKLPKRKGNISKNK